MMSLSFFHFSEYLTTAMFNPETVSFDSFLLNHSVAYGVAAVASWAEYWTRSLYFPAAAAVVASPSIMYTGLAMAVFGDLTRKTAMFTAAKNFSHIIADQHEAGHELVTSGIYSVVRHPSYFGWFWWSVGTQICLGNPICAIGYAFASWKFFSDRIMYEEGTLLRFFGEDYFK